MEKKLITKTFLSLLTISLSLGGLPSYAKEVKKAALKVEKLTSAKERALLNPTKVEDRFTSWGIDPQKNSSINLQKAWERFKMKKEVIVAVIDTGIDPTHPFLKENLHVTEGNLSTHNFGVDFSKSKMAKTKPYDQHGHGTHVAGIIKSVFPKVKIMALKYYNPQASGQDNLNSTIEALRYAVDQNVDIINYSGGGPEPSLEELRILKDAEKKGILVVAAAGNEESDIDVKKNAYYPASYGLSNILTVTAHDQNLKTLNSSNYGKKMVHISAPGYRIKSALPNKRSGYLTGTSQATAFASGVAALIKSQFPALSFKDIREVIEQSAQKEIALAGKCSTGGKLDATKAQELAIAKSTPASTKKRVVAGKEPASKPGKIHYRLAN